MSYNKEGVTLKDYYDILKVSPSSTISEIKKAYRSRAKQLHPDLNAHSKAQEQFCLLNEAYDFFVTTYSGNQINKHKNLQEEYWFSTKNKKRNRTRKYAEMHFDQFIETDFYQTSESINTLMDVFIIVVLVLALIGIPYIAYVNSGFIALSFFLLLIFFTRKGWFSIIKNQFISLKNRNIFNAVSYLVKKKKTYLIFGGLFSFFVLFHTFGYTFITLPNLLGIYGVALLIGYLFSKILANSVLKIFFRWVIFPFLVSLFFTLNYSFSSNQYQEVYAFENHINEIGQNKEKSALLILEGNKYKEYPGIRFISSDQKVYIARYIEMSVAEGFFGIPVLKAYSLTWADPRKAIHFK